MAGEDYRAQSVLSYLGLRGSGDIEPGRQGFILVAEVERHTRGRRLPARWQIRDTDASAAAFAPLVTET